MRRKGGRRGLFQVKHVQASSRVHISEGPVAVLCVGEQILLSRCSLWCPNGAALATFVLFCISLKKIEKGEKIENQFMLKTRFPDLVFKNRNTLMCSSFCLRFVPFQNLKNVLKPVSRLPDKMTTFDSQTCSVPQLRGSRPSVSTQAGTCSLNASPSAASTTTSEASSRCFSHQARRQAQPRCSPHD